MIITKETLRRYHRGLCSKEEKEAVEKWLKSTNDFSLGSPGVSKEEFDQKKDIIWSKMEQENTELQLPSGSDFKTIPLHGRVMHYAAAVIILCTICLTTYYFLSNPTQRNDGELAYFKDFKTIETQRGQKRTVKLADGSTIRMNYETQIKAPEKFIGDERVVYLSGHAHFDVARNLDKPFIIYTEHSKTQVLGTSFDINTSRKQGEMEVIVTSGKVAFSEKHENDNPVTLSVNDRALLRTDKTIEISKVNAGELTAWKDNQLVFDGHTLQEIIEVLEPWYDVSVSVENPDLLTKDFKWSGNNPPLNIVLKELSFAGRFEYRIDNKKVIIF